MSRINIILEEKSWGEPEMIVDGRKMDTEDFFKKFGDNADEINRRYDIFLSSSQWGDSKKVEVVIEKGWGKSKLSFK